LGAYVAAGVVGVNANNIDAINDALASAPVNGAAATTAPQAHAIVDAYFTLQGDVLSIRATWGDPEGVQPLVHAQAQGPVQDAAAATRLGEQVAQQLQAKVSQQTSTGA
jgi:hypothetical protein